MGKLLFAMVLAMGIALMFSGCATETPRANLLLEQRTIEVPGIKQELLYPCDAVTPPTIKKYMEGSKDEREDMLSRYAIDSMGSIQRCTSDKETIRVINKKQIEKVKEFNELEKERLSNLKKTLQEGKQYEPNERN